MRPQWMSDEEARLEGVLPPVNHAIPPPGLSARILMPWRMLRLGMRTVRRLPTLWRYPQGSPAFQREAERLLRILGIRLRVWNVHRVPESGCVLVWNQASHLDLLVLAAALPVSFRCVFRMDINRAPRLARWIRNRGHFPVDRFDRRQEYETLQEAARFVGNGHYLAVSPEGTRSWDGRVLPMKSSTFGPATEAERPILPIVIHGAHEALPRGRFTVTPRTIEVDFLAPLSVWGYAEGLRELKMNVASAFRAELVEGPPSKRTARVS